MEIPLSWYHFDELRILLENVAKMRQFSSGGAALSNGYKISWKSTGVILTIPKVNAQIQKNP